MNIPFLNKSLVIAISAILCMGVSSVANAVSPIVMDGTTGVNPSGTPINPAPATPTIYTIDGGGTGAPPNGPNGTVNGTNLFFSFSQFGIRTGDTAKFLCTGDCGAVGLGSGLIAPGSVTNVISRVTGGSSSDIYGTLTSTIGTANFWFFNPAGVVFGAGAVVNVPAAFHIGTANSVNFGSHSFGLTTDPTDSSCNYSA